MPAPQPELTDEARAALAPVLELLERERGPSSVRDPGEGWKVHVADSASGLVVPALAQARTICDVGSGAGFPGLVLAAMLPEARVDLVESIGRKCEFIERAAAAGGTGRAPAVDPRSEDGA